MVCPTKREGTQSMKFLLLRAKFRRICDLINFFVVVPPLITGWEIVRRSTLLHGVERAQTAGINLRMRVSDFDGYRKLYLAVLNSC